MWLLNSRGNRHCRNHRYVDDTDPEFWDYSFETMAEYDFPESIKFIQNKTG